MANEKPLRPFAVGGVLDAAYTAGDTTITSEAFSVLPVVSTDGHIDITLNPDGEGNLSPFVKRVTAHSAAATTVTVAAAPVLGSDASLPIDTYWVAALVPDDVNVPTFPLLHARDEKAQNTAGGTFTSGAWQTRTLNTVKTNEIVGAAVAANQITLPAGTYEIDGSAPAYGVNRHRARLYDTIGAAVLVLGSSAAAGTGTDSRSFLRGRFVLTTPSILELQHRCETTAASNGFGVESNFDVEVYADVLIRKVQPT
jgi:hypothetical protein